MATVSSPRSSSTSSRISSLYVQNDSEFNEAFATAVENEGLSRWLALRGRSEQMREYLRGAAEDQAFVQLFAGARQRLAQLYASGLPEAAMRRKQSGAAEQLDRPGASPAAAAGLT